MSDQAASLRFAAR